MWWLLLRFLRLLFALIVRTSQRLLLHTGDSHKAEHLKVIKNKVLNPSQMHDIQSVGHTWLRAHKTLQVQTVARALLRRWGTRRHFRWHSNPFSASQYWASLRQGQGQLGSLCWGSHADGLQLPGEILLLSHF